jgi:peptidyl-prolyl cis-trans isomerase D
MSTLQFLREKAGVLVAGVIGFSLFLFVISDFFGNGRGQRIKQRNYYEIGRINGEYISYQDYETKLQNLLEIYKLSGRSDIDEATNENLREQTWQEMVRSKILDNQYNDLGIAVSTEETDELVLGNDPHPIVQQLFTDSNTGTFNKSFLVNFLKQTETNETAKKYWLFFEDQIVNDRMNTKYNTLVSKGLYTTSKQAEFEKTLNLNTTDFSFVLKNYASISDSSVKVTSNEIQTYYTNHKNNFKKSALRDIEYVAFDVVPSEDDMKQAEEWINKTKGEFVAATDPVEFINLTADSKHEGFYVPLTSIPDNLKDFVKSENRSEVFGPYFEEGSYKLAKLIEAADRPDSVHVRHILLSPDQTKTVTDLYHEADSLIKLIKSGISFESLAITNSSDKGSAQIGGDLGWFTEGRMVIPFNNACFSGKKGDIKTVETTYGVHIIQILDQSKNTRKYNVGIIDRKVVPSSATNQKVYSEASEFAGTNNSYDKFIKAIAAKGQNKLVANDVSAIQKTLPGLENPRSLIMSLFQASKNSIILDNNQQAVFEVGDKYVVAFCTKIQEEGIASVEDVTNDIKYILVRDKKADIISAEFNKNNGAGKTIEDISRAMNLNVQEAAKINFKSYTVQGAGTEPALIGAASVAKQGVVCGPIKGTNGVYMLVANNVTTSATEDTKAVQQQLNLAFQLRGSYEAYEALRKSANVIDKRYKFY